MKENFLLQRGSKIVGWLKTVDNFITTNGNDLIFCGIIEIGCPILSRGFASWGPSPLPLYFFCYKLLQKLVFYTFCFAIFLPKYSGFALIICIYI